MAGKKKAAEGISPAEKLKIRVSEMINSPRAQAARCVTVYRIDSDTDAAWDAVLEGLAEAEELRMIFNDDGSLTLEWDEPDEEEKWIDVEAFDYQPDSV